MADLWAGASPSNRRRQLNLHGAIGYTLMCSSPAILSLLRVACTFRKRDKPPKQTPTLKQKSSAAYNNNHSSCPILHRQQQR
mmetsp:Transcript_12378/g.14826  ORF Transcript_12378/g.14826 Transcript_12378/m.14826 type:complete len:82 (+) Transcript_12378:334-579(+)